MTAGEKPAAESEQAGPAAAMGDSPAAGPGLTSSVVDQSSTFVRRGLCWLRCGRFRGQRHGVLQGRCSIVCAGRFDVWAAPARTVSPPTAPRAATSESLARRRTIRATSTESATLRSVLRRSVVAAMVDELGKVAELVAAELVVAVAVEPFKQSFQWQWAVVSGPWRTTPATTLVRPARSITARRRAVRATTESLAHLFASLAHLFAHRLPLRLIELTVSILVEFVQHPLPEFRILHSGTALRRSRRPDLRGRRFVLGCGHTHGARQKETHHHKTQPKFLRLHF